MGRRLGEPADPLLVSVRSGAKFSMPGMMDTVLNLGLNDTSVEGLAKQTSDERFAYDAYRRFIAMFGRIVLGVDGARFDRLLDDAKRPGRRDQRRRGAAELLRYLVRRSQQIVAETGRAVPPGPDAASSRMAIEAVFRSWNGARAVAYRTREHIPHDLGTAVNVQAMVFGNRDDELRDRGGLHPRPRDRARRARTATSSSNAQGEDVVAGIRATLPLVGPRRPVPRDPRRAASTSSPGSSATTATCSTPSSRSSRASSGCSRRASASAPGARRCAWRWR